MFSHAAPNPKSDRAPVARTPVAGKVRSSPRATRLKLGPTDDEAERKADWVSRRVSHHALTPADAVKAARTEASGLEGRVRAMPGSVGLVTGVPPEVETSLQQAQSRGQTLPDEHRSAMENVFGHSFGNLRIHADDEADKLSQRLGARAFTNRNHVFFARQEYAPATPRGRAILAHELTHVLQQASTGDRIQRKTGFEYELDVPVMKGKGDVPESAPQDHKDTYKYVTKAGADTKEMIADRGYDRGLYKVVTDHGAITEAVQGFQKLFQNDQHVGNKVREQLAKENEEPAKLEYVTKELDEGASDYATKYSLQIRTVAESISGLMAQHLANRTIKMGDYTIGVPADLRPPVVAGKEQSEGWNANVAHLRNAVNFNAYMQATAGIDIKRVPALLRHDVPQSLVSHRVHREILGRLNPYVDQTMRSFPALDSLGKDGYDALRGFVTLVIQYLLSYAFWKTENNPGGTSKNLAPFWIKANLSEIRTRLPEGAADYIHLHRQKVKDAIVSVGSLINKLVLDTHRRREVPEDEQPFSGQFVPGTEEQLFIFAVIFDEYDKISERPTIGPYEQRGALAVPLEFRSIEAHPAAAELVRDSIRIVHAVRELHGQPNVNEFHIATISQGIETVAREMELSPKAFLDALWAAAHAKGMDVTALFDDCLRPATREQAREIVRQHVEA